MKPISFTLLILTCFLLLNSCKKSDEGANWDVDAFAPLIRTSLNMGDLVNDSLISENPDKSLNLVFDNTIFSLSLDTLVNIPDTIIEDIFTWLGPATDFAPGQPFYNDNQENTYNISNVKLVEAVVRSGSVKLALTSTIDEASEVTYSLPLATKNSQPLSITEIVPANSTLERTIDLSGYKLDLKGTTGNKFNTMVIEFEAKVDPNGQTVKILNQDKFKIKNEFVDIIPQFAKGYFGQLDYNIAPTITGLNLLQNIQGGTLNLESINMEFTVSNEIGVDATATINILKSINSMNSNEVSLNHSIIGERINMNRAVQYPQNNPPVDPAVFSVQMNSNNSNVEQFIENLPDQAEYSIDLKINPLGNVSNNNDFIYFGTGIDINLDFELPLSFAASNITLQDSVEFNFGESVKEEDKNRYIVDGNLYLYADNGFPFDATTQLFLFDSTNTLIDSLIAPDGYIAPALLDEDLRVSEAIESMVTIPVSEKKINSLYATSTILIKVTFNTASQPDFIKLYSDYGIDFKLIGDFSYNINLTQQQ